MVQDQEEYRKREADLQKKFDAAKAEYDKAEAEIQAAGAKRKAIKAMIRELESRDELLTEFDESLWSGLVDCMTVYRDGRIVVRFRAGIEMEAY